MTTTASDLYYDPYDFAIDADPYPVWKRLRDEAPLYYNEKYDFFAVSRYEDVERCFVEWQTYSSAKGSVLELIKADMEMPPGVFIFEDPPDHDLHRGLMSRVFTPRRMAQIEPQVRAYAARKLDPLVGAGGFDFIADLGVEIPMRTIGMLLGIPEEDQEKLRGHIDDSLRLDEGVMPGAELSTTRDTASDDYGAYIDWRAENPSDDLMTELLNAEFTDEHGTVRTLTRDEILGYVTLLAGAGNETTTRLVGWAAKLLAEHPDQRKMLVDEPALIPNAVEELLRYEAPSPVQARYVTKDVEHQGQTVAAGNVILILNGSANRDERQFEDPDRFDVTRKMGRHLSFGYGIHFCLGAHLARLEARIALEEVLQRFPEWEVDYDNAVQARTSTVRGWRKCPSDSVSEAIVVLTEVVDRTLVITLNRPAVRNAFDSQLSLGVLAAFRTLDADPDLRVGILTGSGGSFCAGMDLKAFARDGLPEKIDTVLRYGCRKPLIAAIEGIAVGGGLELALTADLLVASTDARFGSPEVKFGLFPAGGALLRLPRHLPQSLVTEMSLTGELISAQTAFERADPAPVRDRSGPRYRARAGGRHCPQRAAGY